MIRRPGKAYVWVTWITGLLAETDKCAWRAWVKAQHKSYDKIPDSLESQQRLSGWIKIHNKMTDTRVAQLREQGYRVEVEDANSFKLEGERAILAGKPDIVAINDAKKQILVVDEKSGKVKKQYIWQVLIYIMALSMTKYKDGWSFKGEVEYTPEKCEDGEVYVKTPEFSISHKKRIFEVMQVVGGDQEPPRTPSKWECQYCDILGCPDRFDDSTQVVGF